MMAKCAQKQLRRPQYDDYASNYDKMEADEDIFFKRFKANKYFLQIIKEYSNAVFYKEAYNRCSYLRDFVRKK